MIYDCHDSIVFIVYAVEIINYIEYIDIISANDRHNYINSTKNRGYHITSLYWDIE